MQPTKLQLTAQRFLLACGMLYTLSQLVVLLHAGLVLLPRVGPPTDPIASRVAAFTRNRELFALENFLMGFPPVFFLLFLGGLYHYFRKSHAALQGLVFAMLLGGAAMVMLWPTGAILSGVGIEIGASGGDPITANAIDMIVPHSLSLSGFPRAVFLFGISLLLWHRRGLAYTGFLLMLLSLAGGAAIANNSLLPVTFAAILLFLIWMFWCSVVLFRWAGAEKESSPQRQEMIIGPAG